MDNQRRRMFSTYLMNPQQRQRMERAYGNVTNRMVNYLQAKGIQERYDRKVSAKIRQGRSARGLSNG